MRRHRLDSVPDNLAHARALLESVVREGDTPPLTVRRRILQAARLLGITLHVPPPVQNTPVLSRAAKASVLDHIRVHLASSLTVPSLAAVARLSESHFCRAFKATFGLPTHLYITQMRLQRANALIRDTHMPLSEVAVATGFCDQSHMCNLFRRTYGETPGRIRRSQGAS